MNNIESIMKTLEEKSRERFGKPFTLTNYSLNEDGAMYNALGTMLRHGEPVNVEVSFKKKSLEPWYWAITDDAITMSMARIGTIELSENVCVTDPCYDHDVWCMSHLTDVKPGLWDVIVSIDEIDCWGKRVYILELYHQELTKQQDKLLKWISKAELGVDSGQMSVFDDAFYRRKNGSIDEFKADTKMADRFLNECFDLSMNYAGIFMSDGNAVGVVCSSGCGDGSYPLEVKEFDNKIVAMKISFM